MLPYSIIKNCLHSLTGGIRKAQLLIVAGLLFISFEGQCRQAFHLFGYKLVWSDEFNDTELNRKSWSVEVNGSGCGNRELEYYVDSKKNVDVKDGNLVITARKEKHQGKEFTSGRLNTRNKVSFRYGIVEARIKFPKTANGLWPAFWMMGEDISTKGWPRCGETDILEMGHSNGFASGNQEKLFNGAMHWANSNGHHCQHVGDRINEYSLQDGEYHTFYTVWTPQKIEMYLDDITSPYLVIDISNSSDKDAPGYYFNKPNFILFNLAIGGNFTGILDPSAITALDKGEASMFVDYIRIYQNDEPGCQLTINDPDAKEAR